MDMTAIRRLALAAPPLALAVLAGIHPFTVGEDSARWMLVHVLQLPLVALLGIAVHLLLTGIAGRAAVVARLAVLPWVVGFAAFDALAGLAHGVVVDIGAGHPEAAAAVAAIEAGLSRGPLIELVGFLAVTGSITASIAMGVAVTRASGSLAGSILAAAGGVAWTLVHPLIGAPAMVLFAAGALLIDGSLHRRSRAAAAPALSAPARS